MSTERDVHEGEKMKDIAVLYCRRCVSAAADLRLNVISTGNARIRLTMMPCTSKIEISHILKLLERGADGVQLVGCTEKACQFLVGSRTAARRVERTRWLLGQIGVSETRVGMSHGSDLETTDLVEMAARRAVAVVNARLPKGKSDP
jgi:coenzyme F420-reducing hydrogenase delta subunit